MRSAVSLTKGGITQDTRKPNSVMNIINTPRTAIRRGTLRFTRNDTTGFTALINNKRDKQGKDKVFHFPEKEKKQDEDNGKNNGFCGNLDPIHFIAVVPFMA
jgi:hypothetical protein